MKPEYSAPDIDTASAQRQAADAQVIATENFVSVRELSSGAGNLATGSRASKPGSGALNDFFFETDTNWLYFWSGTAWIFMCGLNFGTNATRAAITVSASDNGAAFFTTDQNKLWQVSGGVWVDRSVTFDLTTSLKVAGTKVIGAQGAAVADPTGGAVIDVEARAQLSLLLARVRTHGMIAT